MTPTIKNKIREDISQGSPAPARDPSELSDNFLKFVSLYVDGVQIHEAWVQAGYQEASKYRAKAKLREHWKTVEKLIDERIGDHVPEALCQIVALMRTSKSDTIRMKCAQDLLSRAGKDKPISINHMTDTPEDKPDDELDEEIKKILKDMNKNSELYLTLKEGD